MQFACASPRRKTEHIDDQRRCLARWGLCGLATALFLFAPSSLMGDYQQQQRIQTGIGQANFESFTDPIEGDSAASSCFRSVFDDAEIELPVQQVSFQSFAQDGNQDGNPADSLNDRSPNQKLVETESSVPTQIPPATLSGVPPVSGQVNRQDQEIQFASPPPVRENKSGMPEANRDDSGSAEPDSRLADRPAFEDSPVGMLEPLREISPSTETDLADTLTDGATSEATRKLSPAIRIDTKPKVEEVVATPWPVPRHLISQIDSVSHFSLLAAWADSTTFTLEMFGSPVSTDDPAVEAIFKQLGNQINELDSLIIRSSTCDVTSSEQAAGPLAAQLRSLQQQLAQYYWIAGLSYQTTAKAPQLVQGEKPQIPIVTVSNQRLVLPPLHPAWEKYLKLEELRAGLEPGSDPRTRRQAAQKFLAQYHSPAINVEQKKYLASQIAESTIAMIREKSFEPVNVTWTMELLGKWQETGHGFYAAQLSDTLQGLTWHDDDQARLFAATMEQQLRGANFRVSVSGEFLNRMLPAQPEVSAPVNEQVMGAHVRGHSRIANWLKVRLIPDNEKIQMSLESIGSVRSQTEATQQGVTISNQGESRFQVLKKLQIGRNGIMADQSLVNASVQNRVVGMRSRYDGLPILGWVARTAANRQIAEKGPIAERLFKQKVESEVSARFEEEIDAHLADLQGVLSSTLIEPLMMLELDPVPTEMRSTEDRIVMQYRMAGRDQLAAGTARPLGLQDSLMSMQLHETLINNVLARIELSGNTFTGPELAEHLATVFSQPVNPEAGNHEFVLTFSAYDPIAVHFVDGSAVVELNIRSLKLGRQKPHRNLRIQLTYDPVVEGETLKLVQDSSGVSLKGSSLSFRDQAALRAIFAAMFDSEYTMKLIPATITERLGEPLRMTQMDLRDGWLAISLDLAGSPQSLQSPNNRPTSYTGSAPVVEGAVKR